MKSTELEHGDILTNNDLVICVCVLNAKVEAILTIRKQQRILKGQVARMQTGNTF
jgi:hypothetical protein